MNYIYVIAITKPRYVVIGIALNKEKAVEFAKEYAKTLERKVDVTEHIVRDNVVNMMIYFPRDIWSFGENN